MAAGTTIALLMRYADYAAIVFRRGRPMARRSPLTRPGRQRRDLRDERRRHEPHATPLTTRHTTNCPRGGEGHSTATRETRRIGGPSSASRSTSVCDSTTRTPGFPRNTCPPFRSWARETLPPSPTCRTGQILSPRLGAAYDLFANGGIFTGLISDPRPPSLRQCSRGVRGRSWRRRSRAPTRALVISFTQRKKEILPESQVGAGYTCLTNADEWRRAVPGSVLFA